MRAHLSEQDLTDYALNELDPHQRMYVESLLAVSEECRNDVYRNIEMAQLLEEGFEREAVFAERQDLHLREDQRAHLTKPHHRLHYFFRDVIGAVGLAACVAFCISKLDGEEFAGAREAATRVAEVSTKKAAGTVASVVPMVQQVSQDAAAGSGIDLGEMLASLRELAAESSNRLMDASSEMLPDAPEICTPPTRVMEKVQLGGFSEMGP
jgi:anti-sigma factor RsiW